MNRGLVTGIMVAVVALVTAGSVSLFAQEKLPQSVVKAHSSGDLYSGYLVSTASTRAMQDDDFSNPGFLWIDQGTQLWSKVEGEAGKSCASCHKDVSSMKGVAVSYPKYNADTKKIMNIEQRINKCRTDNMKAKAWKYESSELLSMTALVRMQSRGMPVNVSIDGPAAPFYEKGKAFYNQRRGLLNLACSNCHVDNAGQHIRADLLSQGQSNGFPTYRLKWQKLGSLHRRFRGCNQQVRAKRLPAGSDEYTNLELFLGHRGNGLKIEAPSVRR